MLIKVLKALVLGVAVLGLAACQSTGGGADSTGAADDSSTYGAGADGALNAEEMAAQEAARQAEAEQQRLLGITTFYFDFDQSVIKPEARAALEAHAKYLADNMGTKVVLQGHADERGTREYNLALGERRAEAIARYLTVLGVSGQQVEVVSYGEERAAAMGHDESAWSLNRRVELIYQ